MRIAICDDEKVQREQIQKYIETFRKEIPNMIIEQFCYGESLIETYKQGKRFDIIFLDIQMRNVDGIKTAEQIRQTDTSAIIVFITSFVQFVSEAFRQNAFQFLIKPVTQDSFNREFRRIIKQYCLNHQKYTIRNKNGIFALEIKSIVYIESYRHSLIFFTNNGEKYNTTGTISEKESQLAPLGFIRVHQGYLVNMDYIKSINEKDILTTVGITVEMSVRKKSQVLHEFNKYLLGRAL